jgi:hypothetical protein
MRLWREEYSRPVRRGPSAATSVVVHSGLILLAVLATNPAPGLVSRWDLTNRVYYVAPPARMPASDERAKRVKYVDAGPPGPGSGFPQSPRPTGESPMPKVMVSEPGDSAKELVESTESHQSRGMDSVFTIAEVDSAVSTDPTSVAPTYPELLRKLGIEGSVEVHYVVDSTGVADSSSLVVVRASREEFALAVREALPYMHFIAAKFGRKRVSQLVLQKFSFRIDRPKPDTAVARDKKPPRQPLRVVHR